MNAALLLLGFLPLVDEPVQFKGIGITLPKTIANLEYKGTHQYDIEGAGYSATYQNRMSRATLYVYRGQVDKVPEGKAGKVIDAEMKTVNDTIKLTEERGFYHNVQPKPVLPEWNKNVKSTFAISGHTFDIRGGGCVSYTLITGRNNHFFKIRLTQYVFNGESNDAEVKEFLETIADAFVMKKQTEEEE